MRTMAVCGAFLAFGVACAKTTPPSDATVAATPSAPAAAAPSLRADAERRSAVRGEAAPGLAGTSWRVAGAAAAAESPSSIPTLHFDSPEHVSGGTGCNRFSGAAAISGESLKLGPLLTTRRGCASPLMERERDFVKALEACRTWRRADGNLELLDDAGAVVLRLEPASP